MCYYPPPEFLQSIGKWGGGVGVSLNNCQPLSTAHFLVLCTRNMNDILWSRDCEDKNGLRSERALIYRPTQVLFYRLSLLIGP